MLALDIETLGLLQTPLPALTCVCLYSDQAEHRLRFYKVSEEVFEQNKTQLLDELDRATCLAGFNAVEFDLEFIRLFLHVPDAQANAWMLKCIDPFMVAKHMLRTQCGLNHLLWLNGLPCKTGTGSDAIRLAEDERWDELLDYCLMDARLTYTLCTLPSIRFSTVLRGKHVRGLMWHFFFAYERQQSKALVLPTIVELHGADEEEFAFND